MFEAASALLEAAPMSAVSAAVVPRHGAPWTYQRGLAHLETGEALSAAHQYDLASLTKVLVTLPEVLQRLEAGVWALTDPLERFYPQLQGRALGQATLEHLLTHTSGQQATGPLHLSARSRAEVVAQILGMEPPHPLGHYEYSDLGFILLGDLLERAWVTGDRAQGTGSAEGDAREGVRERGSEGAKNGQEENAVLYPLERMALERGQVRYRPQGPCVATEHDPWRGRTLQGEVHDEKAWRMQGVAGHAGAFGTLSDVMRAARFWLETPPERLERMTTPRTWERGGCPRGLGWVLGHPTCSGGTLASPQAFGHTGFTGTSFWVEPERGYALILLTNRVHPTRDTGDEIIVLRREFADAVHRQMGYGGER